MQGEDNYMWDTPLNSGISISEEWGDVKYLSETEIIWIKVILC